MKYGFLILKNLGLLDYNFLLSFQSGLGIRKHLPGRMWHPLLGHSLLLAIFLDIFSHFQHELSIITKYYSLFLTSSARIEDSNNNTTFSKCKNPERIIKTIALVLTILLSDF